MAKGEAIRNPYQRYQPFKKPKLETMVTTLWDYPSQHYGDKEQGSQAYRGATPSWVIWQVLQRFTKPADLVLDPFCGSGTTLDVCKDTERRGLGFDIAPARDDIRAGDARQLPLDDDSVDLAFLDPPYADNLTYSDDPACIGRLRADDGSWHDAMEQVLHEMARVVKPGGHMAIYVSDVRKRTRFFPLGVHLAAMGQTFFRLVDHVAVVRHNKDLEKGNYRKAAAEGGFMLRGFNHLLLFEGPKAERVAPPPERSSSREARAPRESREQRGGSRKPSRGPKPSRRPSRESGADEPARERPESPSRTRFKERAEARGERSKGPPRSRSDSPNEGPRSAPKPRPEPRAKGPSGSRPTSPSTKAPSKKPKGPPGKKSKRSTNKNKDR